MKTWIGQLMERISKRFHITARLPRRSLPPHSVPSHSLLSSRHNKRRSGQALVEMAFVVMILLFLTLGLVQFALISNARVTMTNISREGARYAAVNCLSVSDAAIETHIDNNIAQFTTLRDINASNIVISYPGAGGKNSGQQVRVDINYDVRRKFILPLSFPGLSRFGASTTATTIMLIE